MSLPHLCSNGVTASSIEISQPLCIPCAQSTSPTDTLLVKQPQVEPAMQQEDCDGFVHPSNEPTDGKSYNSIEESDWQEAIGDAVSHLMGKQKSWSGGPSVADGAGEPEQLIQEGEEHGEVSESGNKASIGTHPSPSVASSTRTTGSRQRISAWIKLHCRRPASFRSLRSRASKSTLDVSESYQTAPEFRSEAASLCSISVAEGDESSLPRGYCRPTCMNPASVTSAYEDRSRCGSWTPTEEDISEYATAPDVQMPSTIYEANSTNYLACRRSSPDQIDHGTSPKAPLTRTEWAALRERVEASMLDYNMVQSESRNGRQRGLHYQPPSRGEPRIRILSAMSQDWLDVTDGPSQTVEPQRSNRLQTAMGYRQRSYTANEDAMRVHMWKLGVQRRAGVSHSSDSSGPSARSWRTEPAAPMSHTIYRPTATRTSRSDPLSDRTASRLRGGNHTQHGDRFRPPGDMAYAHMNSTKDDSQDYAESIGPPAEPRITSLQRPYTRCISSRASHFQGRTLFSPIHEDAEAAAAALARPDIANPPDRLRQYVRQSRMAQHKGHEVDLQSSSGGPNLVSSIASHAPEQLVNPFRIPEPGPPRSRTMRSLMEEVHEVKFRHRRWEDMLPESQSENDSSNDDA